MNTLTIEFEEIPTVLIDGAEGGWVDGKAEIEFDRERCWSIQSISLELYGKGGRRYVPVSATDNAPLLSHLTEMLEDRYERYILSEIDAYCTAAREDAAEARYEARRDERMWG